MQSIVYFCWLAWMATGGLLVFWPATLFVAVLLLGCFAAAMRKEQLPRARSSWLALAAVPLVILIWGTLFRNAGHLGTKQLGWQLHTLWIMMLAIIPAAAAAVWQSRRQGWFVVGAASLMVGYYAFWAMYIAILSVTGNW